MGKNEFSQISLGRICAVEIQCFCESVSDGTPLLLLSRNIMFIQLGNGPLQSSRTLQYTTTKSTTLTMYIKKNPHSEQCSAFRKISWVCVIKRFVNRRFQEPEKLCIRGKKWPVMAVIQYTAPPYMLVAGGCNVLESY